MQAHSGVGTVSPPRLRLKADGVQSSLCELLLFNCDEHEFVRYGNLARNSRCGLSESTLRNRPLRPDYLVIPFAGGNSVIFSSGYIFSGERE